MSKRNNAAPRMILGPAEEYVASRCQAIFFVWWLNGALQCAPRGWTVEKMATGDYNIYPYYADVPHGENALALASLFGVAAGDPPQGIAGTSRTFLVGFDTDANYFRVRAIDGAGNLTDSDFGLLIVVPG